MTEIQSQLNDQPMCLNEFKFSYILLSVFITVHLQAQQIIVSSAEKSHVYEQFEHQIDWLVMINGITPSTEIKVILPESSLSVTWVRYPDQQFMSNQLTLSPDDHTGYIAKISGTLNGKPYNKEMTVWVIDYKLYRPSLNALIPDDPQKGNCDQLTLNLDSQLPEMYYKTPSTSKFKIKRNFNVQYESLEWDGAWKTKEINQTVNIEGGKIDIVDPPYKDTYFTLTGDQFATDMDIEPDILKSNYYSAIRVKAKIQTEASIRTEKNEGDRPESITTISGSAPLEINFTANGNVPVASYYQWQIYSGSDVIITRTDESHRYTFTQAGTYLVKLSAENAYCSFTDSMTIKVSESAISAPNFFTPNGDGIHDEFRVAYKSILEFDCWIFNRWGSKVYHWTNPQKGWDGTVKGKAALEGAYFYVIKALGSDGVVYHLKGDVNLLRGKQ